LFCYDENEDYLIVTFQDVSGKEVVEKSDHLYTLSDPSLCIYFFHLFAKKPNLEKKIHNFHLSKSSFTCPGLRSSGSARRLWSIRYCVS